MSRVRACASEELHAGQVHVVSLGIDGRGLPRQALVLRDRLGRVRAYLNRCKHLPIPLDGGTREFFDDDRVHLVCRTHGAAYRPEDGLCVEGPCEGASLTQLEVTIEGGSIYLDAGTRAADDPEQR